MTQAREGRPKNTGCPKTRKSAQNRRDTMSPFLFPPFYTRTYEQIVFAWYNGAPAQAASRSNPVFWAPPIHHWPASSSSSSSPASDAHKKRERENGTTCPPFLVDPSSFCCSLSFLGCSREGEGRGASSANYSFGGGLVCFFASVRGWINKQAWEGKEGPSRSGRKLRCPKVSQEFWKGCFQKGPLTVMCNFGAQEEHKK